MNAYELELVHNGERWNRGLLTLPHPHVLQTWEWGEVKSQTGWRPHPLRVLLHGHPVGQVLLLVRPLRPLPLAVGYVPKGPVLDWSAPLHVSVVLKAIADYASQQGLLFVKIDPDVDPRSGQGKQVQTLLRDHGWVPSPEAIQFRNTVLLDLQGDEEELLKRMKPKWRYNIRLARRRGVRIRQGKEEDFPHFYALYAETARRDGFLIRPYAYYEKVWRVFLSRDMAVLLMAEWEGRPIAGLMLFLFGHRAWYMYGASAGGDVRRHMPNHLLQWEAIRVARTRGCTVYDMWGAPDVLDESDPMWGVYRFKLGFGGVFQPWIGPWDLPLSPLYVPYTRVWPRLMRFLSRSLTRARAFRHERPFSL